MKRMISLICLLVQSSLWANMNRYFITFNRQSFIFWGVKKKSLSFLSLGTATDILLPGGQRDPDFFLLDQCKGRPGRSWQLRHSGKSKTPAYHLCAPSGGEKKGKISGSSKQHFPGPAAVLWREGGKWAGGSV